MSHHIHSTYNCSQCIVFVNYMNLYNCCVLVVACCCRCSSSSYSSSYFVCVCVKKTLSLFFPGKCKCIVIVVVDFSVCLFVCWFCSLKFYVVEWFMTLNSIINISGVCLYAYSTLHYILHTCGCVYMYSLLYSLSRSTFILVGWLSLLCHAGGCMAV